MTVDMVLCLVFVVAVWVALAQILRGRSPVGYWYLSGYPLTVIRMLWTWKRLVVQVGLVGDRRGARVLIAGMAVHGQTLKPIVPNLRPGRPLRDGLVARVRLLPGQVPEEYAKQSEAILHAWRVQAVRVSSPRRGWVEIRAFCTDPLSGLVVRDASWSRSGDPSDTPTGGMSLALVVGVREDARAWVIDLRLVPHWMIVGATRSGKSTLIHSLVVALSVLPVALVGIDLKGGLELSVYRPRLSGLATTRKEAAGLLEAVLDLAFGRMDQCRLAGVQTIWQLPEVPSPVIVLVDEVAELYLQSDASEKALRDQCAATLLRLAQLGAALGICLLVCGQRIGSDLGAGATALRAQLGGRISHRVNDEETAKMCLGDVFPEAVQAVLMLTPADQGVAVSTDGMGGWVRARSALTSAQQAADIAKQNTAMTPVLAGIARPEQPGGGEAA
jgi:S-DNA-T family DNA segregation ATPase FtsK/SpoIIIE